MTLKKNCESKRDLAFKKKSWEKIYFCLHIFEKLPSKREEIGIGTFSITSENRN